jgi:hypothetical protein
VRRQERRGWRLRVRDGWPANGKARSALEAPADKDAARRPEH